MANADNFIPTDEAVSCWRHDPLAAGKLKIGYVEVPGPSGGGSGLTPEFWGPTTWIGSYVRTNIHVSIRYLDTVAPLIQNSTPGRTVVDK